MRMLLAGFQRREKKFASFPELVATIKKVRYREQASIGSLLSTRYTREIELTRPRINTSPPPPSMGREGEVR